MLKRCDITPYEGNKPYIFISYAHKDSHVVFPILEELDRRGYRIWYDDGIAPGSEWPENIAQHLSGCSLTMAFVSPNSIASDNCRREVTFALSKRKPFLGIILEPTEMSLGMEMQLSAQQCIMKYTYDSDAAFYQKVCSCSDMECCWEKPSAPSAAVPQPAPKPAPQPAPKVAPAPKPEKAPISFDQFFKANKKWIIPTGCGILALVAILCIVLLIPKGGPSDSPNTSGGSLEQTTPSTSGKDKVTITDDLVVDLDTSALGLEGETITADMADQISRLTDLSVLTLMDCQFASGALEHLQLPDTVTELIITNASGLDSLGFLSQIPNVSTLVLDNVGLTDAMIPDVTLGSLHTLSLSGNGKLTDLSKFSGCENLTNLVISGTAVPTLEGIPGNCLQSIDFSGTPVSDVSPLSACTELLRINGAESGVRNIDALASLSKLEMLDFRFCGIEEINTTFSCLRLKELYLGFNNLSYLSAFTNCAVLRNVDVSYNNYISVSILSKSAATLETLDVSGNSIFEDKLNFLLNAPNLTELYADLCYLENLNFLANSTKLEKLSVLSSDVTDISGLSNCPNLYYICLGQNEITDISPLSGIRTTQKVYLDLGVNPIDDLSALPDVDYGVLNIMVTGEGDGHSTMSRVSGDTILVLYSDTLQSGYLKNKPFTDYYVIGCPADKQVAIEDFFGIDHCWMVNDFDIYIDILQELGFQNYEVFQEYGE